MSEKTAETALLLEQLYPMFNARNIEQIMPHFSVNADWPNGMTGGREIGHDAIREYWTNQWMVIDSKVTPISYRVVHGHFILEVHQLVKDMEGKTLLDGVVYHTYKFVDGKIERMDISSNIP
ncbi:unnamed protein product, partial [Scytosiphon promiscuus]